ncbi:MAG: 1-acyl-sn-glycerol-3-phosphate acyltransferase [Chitinophagaceae bacterium]|nr:MAG: 1-acyl-sn-glycerol-3-phosphate acyltransferase [Chitinophagaceae bacterium]
MRYLWKPFQLLYALYAMLLFIALMIPVFIWALLVVPFGPVRGGNLLYKACSLWGDIWFFLVFIRHRNIDAADYDHSRAFIYVSTHTSYFDIPVIVKTVRRPVRALGKAEIARVPIFGYIYRNAIVTVDRSSPEHRARSVRLMKSYIQQGISVLVFPEGTFNETGEPLKDFYDGAFRIAIETGTPIQPLLMLDTWSRMHPRSIFSLRPGKSRTIFLEPVAVEGYTLESLPALKAAVRDRMERALREWKAPWIKA